MDAREFTTSQQVLSHELSLLKKRLDQSNFSQLNNEAAALDQQGQQATAKAEKARALAADTAKKIASLERCAAHFETADSWIARCAQFDQGL